MPFRRAIIRSSRKKNEKANLNWKMNNRWRTYLIQLWLGVFFSFAWGVKGKSNEKNPRVNGATSETVWLGAESLQQPEKCLSWFVWFVRLIAPPSQTWACFDETAILENASPSPTQCAAFCFSRSPHSERDEKAQTRLWQLWDGSISHISSLIRSECENFEDLSRDSRGAADEVCVFFSTNVEISCTQFPFHPASCYRSKNSVIWMFLRRIQSHGRPSTVGLPLKGSLLTYQVFWFGKIREWNIGRYMF